MAVNTARHEAEKLDAGADRVLQQRWGKILTEPGQALWLDKEGLTVRLSPP